MGTDLASFSQIGSSILPGQAFKPWEDLAGDRLWAGHLKGQLRLGEEVFSSPDSSFFVQVLIQARSLFLLVPVCHALCLYPWASVAGRTQDK